MSTNQERVHALFSIVRYLAVEDRKAYLDKECVDDAELREEVESLLKYAPTSAPSRVLTLAPPINKTTPLRGQRVEK
jgi:hypothetical protein